MPIDQTFPKTKRLRKTSEFQLVFERRRSVADARLILYFRPNDLGHPRLGLSVSRKVGNAVIRNRWKRIIREVFRKVVGVLPLSLDLVAVPKRGIAPPTSGEIEASFRFLLKRIKSKDNPVVQ